VSRVVIVIFSRISLFAGVCVFSVLFIVMCAIYVALNKVLLKYTLMFSPFTALLLCCCVSFCCY